MPTLRSLKLKPSRLQVLFKGLKVFFVFHFVGEYLKDDVVSDGILLFGELQKLAVHLNGALLSFDVLV